jgi:hypothetical protein
MDSQPRRISYSCTRRGTLPTTREGEKALYYMPRSRNPRVLPPRDAAQLIHSTCPGPGPCHCLELSARWATRPEPWPLAPRPNRLGRLDLARQSMRRQGLVSTKRHDGANHAAPCDHFPLLGCNFQTSLQNASALLDEIGHGVRKLLVRCLSWAVPFNVLL